MKAKSKLLALLLALVMVFSMSLPAFAADDEAAEAPETTSEESAEAAGSEEPAESEPAASEEPGEVEVPAAELEGTIIILHTNDVHGGIAVRREGGQSHAEYHCQSQQQCQELVFCFH